MDFPAIIRQRIAHLGLKQRYVAVAARVTESYISQLLTRKKAPPAPERADIYGKMEEVLKFLNPGISTLQISILKMS